MFLRLARFAQRGSVSARGSSRRASAPVFPSIPLSYRRAGAGSIDCNGKRHDSACSRPLKPRAGQISKGIGFDMTVDAIDIAQEGTVDHLRTHAEFHHAAVIDRQRMITIAQGMVQIIDGNHTAGDGKPRLTTDPDEATSLLKGWLGEASVRIHAWNSFFELAICVNVLGLHQAFDPGHWSDTAASVFKTQICSANSMRIACKTSLPNGRSPNICVRSRPRNAKCGSWTSESTCAGCVRSHIVMEGIGFESLRLFCPDLTNVFVWGQTAQCF